MRKCTIFFLLQHVSISSSFSAYNITVCYGAFMSSWHEALFCLKYQVLSTVSGNAELRPSEKASTKSRLERNPIFPDLFKHLFLPLYTVASTRCSIPVRCLLLTPPLLSVVRYLPCSIITVPSHDCYSFLCRDDCPSATCLWLKWKILLPLSCVPRKMLFSRSLRNNSIFSFSFLSCPLFLVWFLTAMENGFYEDCLLIWKEMHL